MPRPPSDYRFGESLARRREAEERHDREVEQKVRAEVHKRTWHAKRLEEFACAALTGILAGAAKRDTLRHSVDRAWQVAHLMLERADGERSKPTDN
jgi:hypothetical protein